MDSFKENKIYGTLHNLNNENKLKSKKHVLGVFYTYFNAFNIFLYTGNGNSGDHRSIGLGWVDIELEVGITNDCSFYYIWTRIEL